MRFADYISPMAYEDFTNKCLGRSVAYFSGHDRRFATLVTGDEISEALSRIIANPNPLRLLGRDGYVPAEKFIKSSGQIETTTVEHYLKDGATLFVDSSERIFPNIYSMCCLLSDAFRAKVRATLIASVVSAPGHIHWDTHDVFVCQVAGQKRWPVFKPTHVKPLAKAKKGEIKDPTVAWEGVLTPGDALYVPRGWPHEPVMVVPPSIHVTFDIFRQTGHDMLQFLFGNLTDHELVRTDLPILLSSEERRSYNSQLRDLVMNRMADYVFDAYYSAQHLRHAESHRSLGVLMTSSYPVHVENDV